jgi:hypothetical protein
MRHLTSGLGHPVHRPSPEHPREPSQLEGLPRPSRFPVAFSLPKYRVSAPETRVLLCEKHATIGKDPGSHLQEPGSTQTAQGVPSAWLPGQDRRERPEGGYPGDGAAQLGRLRLFGLLPVHPGRQELHQHPENDDGEDQE